MIFVEPEKSVADEEISYLVATEIEDICAPLVVHALTRVGMLVQV